jgi:large subunit ribosomal protein L19
MIKFQETKFSLTSYLNKQKDIFTSLNVDKSFIKPGNLISLTYKLPEIFKNKLQKIEGLIIKCQNRGLGKSFTIYYTLQNIKIKHLFVLNSPNIITIKKKSSYKIRRAKLYYLYKKLKFNLIKIIF